MAKVTSSRDRSTRTRTKPVTNSARRPSRQRNSNATVTSSEGRSNNGGRRVTTDAGRPSRTLPPRGGTSAGSPKAVGQRVASAVTQRAQQDIMRTVALADNMRRNQARDARQIPADKSPKVRYVPPGGANAKPQGALPPASGPSRREAAQGRADRAAAGSSGSGVRTGQPGRGGALVSQRGPSVDRRQPRLGADTRGKGVRIGNSSQPWGEQPPRQVQVRDVTGQPQLTGRNQQALPQGRPTRMEQAQAKAAQAKAGTRGSGVRTAGGAAAGSVVRGALGTVGRNVGIGGAMLGAMATADSIRRNLPIDLKNLGNAIYNSTTPSGGTKKRYEGDSPVAQAGNRRVDASNREAWRRQNDKAKGTRGPAVPDSLTRQEATRSQTESTRQLRLAQQSNNDAPRPTRPSTGSSGSSGSTTPSRSSRAAVAAPSSQSSGSTKQASGSGSDWKSFNPGRGTSRTNNPLIKKDEWLMGKLNQREQATADTAINEGKASKARYSVEASPAEYNVSEEEGKNRLKIAEEKKRKQQQSK